MQYSPVNILHAVSCLSIVWYFCCVRLCSLARSCLTQGESRSTIVGGGDVTNFVPVLGRDGTKIAPPEELFD